MEVKPQPQVSEVRPLNQVRRVSWNQNQDQDQDQVPEQKRNQDQTQPAQAGNQILQSQVEEQETPQTHQHSPGKKKIQTAIESLRNQGPVAWAAASHLKSSSGLRKAQSVQSLLTNTGNTQRSQTLRTRTETKVQAWLDSLIQAGFIKFSPGTGLDSEPFLSIPQVTPPSPSQPLDHPVMFPPNSSSLHSVLRLSPLLPNDSRRPINQVPPPLGPLNRKQLQLLSTQRGGCPPPALHWCHAPT